MILHTDRYYPTKTLVKLGVVVHDSESGDGSSVNLVRALASKGDKPSDRGPGLFYGAGYHGVTDGYGSYINIADATAGPYSAPPLNPTWWHCCMPGFANQTREQWLDDTSKNHIKGVAQFIVDKWRADGQTWPLLFRSAAELKTGKGGYTAHYQVSLAWHQTTHTDPGSNFPWDVLEQNIAALTQVPQEDDMQTARLVRFKGFVNVFLVGGGGPAMAVGEADYDHLESLGIPKVFVDHRQEFLSVCNQAQLDPKDDTELIPGGPDDRF